MQASVIWSSLLSTWECLFVNIVVVLLPIIPAIFGGGVNAQVAERAQGVQKMPFQLCHDKSIPASIIHRSWRSPSMGANTHSEGGNNER